MVRFGGEIMTAGGGGQGLVSVGSVRVLTWQCRASCCTRPQ